METNWKPFRTPLHRRVWTAITNWLYRAFYPRHVRERDEQLARYDRELADLSDVLDGRR